MGILNRRTRRGVFEISSDNGLISIYALCRARGEGGEAKPKVESTTGTQRPEAEREAENGEAGEQCRQLSKKSCYPPVSSASKTESMGLQFLLHPTVLN